MPKGLESLFLAAEITLPYMNTMLLSCSLPHVQYPLPQSRDQVGEKALEKDENPDTFHSLQRCLCKPGELLVF